MVDRTLETFVPLYISNTCDSMCSICNMRSNNKKLHRKEATISEIINQLKIIKEIEKINAVCFLTGEYIESKKRNENIEKIIRIIDYGFRMGYEKIYFNIGSLSINEIDKFYKKFYSKNIVLSLFQETYSQTVYKRYFGNNSLINPKADFNKRLKTAENWINVGFRNIDIGILLGLCEPSNDINQLIIHANKLYKLGAKVHISLPRIRGVNNLKYEVNDDKYIEIIKFIKHKCPWASLIVTTRESVDLIKKSLEYITIVSPGSSDIAPYTISGKIPNNLETSQFVINKNRERPSQILDKIGYKFRYYKEINN